MNNDFLTFRKYFIFGNQVLGILICTYFIFNVKNYELSWKWLTLLAWACPKCANSLNTALSQIGTFILIIPLCIIILSIVFNESFKLKVMSSFFGLSGTILILTSGFLKKTLLETYDMKIFLIKRILSLEEKMNIFKEEYLRYIAENYDKTQKIYEYLLKYLSESNLLLHESHLALLQDRISIRNYVLETLLNLINIYETPVVQKTLKFNISGTSLAWIGGFLTVAALVIGVGQMLAFDPKEGFALVMDGTQLSARATEILTALGSLSRAALEKSLEQNKILATFLYEKITSAVEKAFAKVLERIIRLESRVMQLETDNAIMMASLEELRQ